MLDLATTSEWTFFLLDGVRKGFTRPKQDVFFFFLNAGKWWLKINLGPAELTKYEDLGSSETRVYPVVDIVPLFKAYH